MRTVAARKRTCTDARCAFPVPSAARATARNLSRSDRRWRSGPTPQRQTPRARSTIMCTFATIRPAHMTSIGIMRQDAEDGSSSPATRVRTRSWRCALQLPDARTDTSSAVSPVNGIGLARRGCDVRHSCRARRARRAHHARRAGRARNARGARNARRAHSAGDARASQYTRSPRGGPVDQNPRTVMRMSAAT